MDIRTVKKQSAREEELSFRQRRLARELRRLFEPIAYEPIPQDMISLLLQLGGDRGALIAKPNPGRKPH